ncbi:class I SAM-dependent methyltransferase [Ammoniphilus resinae]|uniref:Ubiquinone/menaquinone biosynthesis C-methylase UbiE n=1 Tax=Ammoniphilus resinae TaxID=861532 RepID=A0ABS4GR42_9BACL|nr:class I SAM-dependent methyltransferase [Ammoniphilus resinae]MBP1932745.1 ubiquinone/menaquinone biosynthesis C-methylase UbiE [Ammoniphilus resinae]
MNNSWNRLIYKLWSPFYDQFFNSGAFLQARKNLFAEETFEKGQNILFVGVGTGADLAWIPRKDLNVTAIDFSPEMLHKAKEKFKNDPITFKEMDAQDLQFADESFDIVVGSLILSVVPDAKKALEEMIRVTKGGGRILIFDKFAPKDMDLSFGKKLIRPLVSFLGTDIGLHFDETLNPYRSMVNLQLDKPIMFGDMYRKIRLVKVLEIN